MRQIMVYRWGTVTREFCGGGDGLTDHYGSHFGLEEWVTGDGGGRVALRGSVHVRRVEERTALPLRLFVSHEAQASLWHSHRTNLLSHSVFSLSSVPEYPRLIPAPVRINEPSPSAIRTKSPARLSSLLHAALPEFARLPRMPCGPPDRVASQGQVVSCTARFSLEFRIASSIALRPASVSCHFRQFPLLLAFGPLRLPTRRCRVCGSGRVDTNPGWEELCLPLSVTDRKWESGEATGSGKPDRKMRNCGEKKFDDGAEENY
ncbi:hypothetical protein MA16_Dca019099 [Dendrobium catenatum]|uniref:Uncharacterized protein n=1 Tax=Dendrobium catenatum TaxID=906689 RepID=A0A2I0WPB2_9ASPA|nr:hypothetical protein MA16_Dca019099 [Dendrobium catenatum]